MESVRSNRLSVLSGLNLEENNVKADLDSTILAYEYHVPVPCVLTS